MATKAYLEQEFMYNELSAKVGGRFRLTVLIQKRLKEINRGAKPLVKIDSDNPTRIVLEEIKQDLIRLEKGMNLLEEVNSRRRTQE